MASTYSSNLRLELIGTGDQQGTWGSTTNVNLGTLLEQAIGGYTSVTVTDGADTVLTVANGSSDQSRNATINLAGALTATRNVICPAIQKLYVVKNATTGGFAVTFKVASQTGVSVPNGSTVFLYVDGTDARQISTSTPTVAIGSVTGLGANVATFLASPSSANLANAVTDETGSGPLVFANSASLVTPTLGVASATSLNKVTITAPASNATLTIANGKTLTANNSITVAGTDGKTLTVSKSLTLDGTDGTTMTFPSTSDTLAGLNQANTFTQDQTATSLNAKAGSGSPAFAMTGDIATARWAWGAGDSAINFYSDNSTWDLGTGTRAWYSATYYPKIQFTSGGRVLATGFYTSGATGGDKGADTINAKNYYKDGVLLSTGGAPLPQSGAGVGQWANLQVTSTNVSLPASGTWVYHAIGFNSSNAAIDTSVGGPTAGGTLIGTNGSVAKWYGFAWRIT